MLIIRLREVMLQLQQRRKSRVSLSEIAAATGIHRKILSRLNNHPYTQVKGETLDSLAQYFFREFVAHLKPQETYSNVMEKVITGLIVVYPDDGAFWDGIVNKGELHTAEMKYQAANALWEKFDKLPRGQKESRLTDLCRKAEEAKPKPKKVSKKGVSKLRDRFG